MGRIDFTGKMWVRRDVMGTQRGTWEVIDVDATTLLARAAPCIRHIRRSTNAPYDIYELSMPVVFGISEVRIAEGFASKSASYQSQVNPPKKGT